MANKFEGLLHVIRDDDKIVWDIAYFPDTQTYTFTLSDDDMYWTLTLNEVEDLVDVNYKFIYDEKEYLVWRLKHGK